jgi:SAM-dependent methyltransferase
LVVVDLDTFRALLADPGPLAVTTAISALDDGHDALRVSHDLRREFTALPASVASAAMTQAQLRRRARAKFGTTAERMWFTADGVEQATRAQVADHRAARFGRLNDSLGRVPRVADLCCGVGGDLQALVRAGCRVSGFDRDPLTIEVARANITALGLADIAAGVGVDCLDVETLDLHEFDAAFLDPARRHNGRRTFDVRAYSPSWPYVARVLDTMPAAVKVAPGIPHDLVADGVEAEWVSFEGDVKEAVLWSGPLATPGVQRRATLLPSGATLVAGDGVPPAVGAPLRYLYEPDGAVVRAHLVAEVAQLIGGRLLDASTAYLTSDQLVPTPFARAFEVEHVMGFSLKQLRHELRARDVGAVTIMKRGSAVDVEKLRHDLRLTGHGHAVVVLALVGGRHQVLIARPVQRS